MTTPCAIVTRPGADSRRGEAALMEPVLKRFYEHVERIEAPGTLDAGDVMMVGDHYYIGCSARTNAEGARQLIAILERYGKTGAAFTTEGYRHAFLALFISALAALAASLFVEETIGKRPVKGKAGEAA